MGFPKSILHNKNTCPFRPLLTITKQICLLLTVKESQSSAWKTSKQTKLLVKILSEDQICLGVEGLDYCQVPGSLPLRSHPDEIMPLFSLLDQERQVSGQKRRKLGVPA